MPHHELVHGPAAREQSTEGDAERVAAAHVSLRNAGGRGANRQRTVGERLAHGPPGPTCLPLIYR